MVLNVEARVGDSMVMVVQARDAHDARPASLYVYVEDTEATCARALECAGSTDESAVFELDDFTAEHYSFIQKHIPRRALDGRRQPRDQPAVHCEIDGAT